MRSLEVVCAFLLLLVGSLLSTMFIFGANEWTVTLIIISVIPFTALIGIIVGASGECAGCFSHQLLTREVVKSEITVYTVRMMFHPRKMQVYIMDGSIIRFDTHDAIKNASNIHDAICEYIKKQHRIKKIFIGA